MARRRDRMMDELKRVVLEEIVAMSADYASKEQVRQGLQDIVMARVASGEIRNQRDLDEFWATVDMAAKALRMIPFAALAKAKKA